MLAANWGWPGSGRWFIRCPAPTRNPGSTALWAKRLGFWITEVCTTRSRDGAPQPAPRSIFAAFPLDLASVPKPQLFTVAIQQRGLVHVLASGPANTKRTCVGSRPYRFDQHDDGVTVHVSGPGWRLRAEPPSIVGPTVAPARPAVRRHRFPGMSSYDAGRPDGIRCRAAGRVGGSGQRCAGRTRVRPIPPLGFYRVSEAFTPAARWGAGRR